MAGQLVPPTDPSSSCVLNFYHLTPLEDPQATVEQHRQLIERLGLDIRGRIYISSQGINSQCGGTVEHATAYAEWIKQQPGFQGLRYTLWPADGHAFPKLRLKHKPNLISLAGGMEGLPITDPAARATPLEPSKWKEMIAQSQVIGKEKKMVVLDVRNDYEWDAGHFEGAERPAEEIFAETPVGEGEQEVPVYLQEVDKDTPVLMYCTGGIRCDVYSTFLRHKGYNNLYTLEGGVQNYLRQEGGAHWKGSLFVFDARMAIPGSHSGDADANLPVSAPRAGVTAESRALPAAVPCSLCGSPDSQLPHVNCANIDCNELFIACAACKALLNGCCCEACMEAPRLLRPAKVDGGHYGAWGNYADRDEVGPVISQGRTREGRVARRARRREALKEKRMEFVAEKLARKKMVREAMARLEALEAQADHPQPTDAEPKARQMACAP
ncbi:hypothetical protein VOLCADRAFT_103426 [Volvox carteri f. nagariensis]|uniref:Rhodanese domain-containing protein n=1 Tax=Volvox carteri f. nagariensis TaxID=3068 RepID=D8TLS6_VOLCA|nr:uncharacterized protein VOLCADRAFT_103426 [Volvox carteri f. nagariensis]EFJ51382.1 hypothetical protein VOLCADRAFT_103426 [Volvox carteri f. nagariensis]|eukprot:XP_002947334.1 hypothetical protein VOLCADRAFT_103426 [Volvox carteri f. nagariensis]